MSTDQQLYTPPSFRIAATYPAGPAGQPDNVEIELNLSSLGESDPKEFVVEIVTSLFRPRLDRAEPAEPSIDPTGLADAAPWSEVTA